MNLEPPRFENGKAFLIAGLREPVKTITSIPALWQRALAHKIPKRVERVDYGVCFNCLGGADSFDYLAGAEVSDLSGLPAELSGMSIPAQRYAVFPHREHVSKLSDTIDTILHKWLPQSGYEVAHPVADAPDFFERYGEDFDPQSGTGGMEVWIPIKS
jgi:AraC family transcriptional regulator